MTYGNHRLLKKTSGTELIDALVTNDVEPKPYKVHRFLNARFDEVATAKDLVMAIR
jgi:hypothetical protein